MLGRHDVAQAQARGQYFGERAQVHAAFGVARGQRCSRFFVVPQVAVGVVFQKRQAQLGAALHHGLATCLVHGAAGGVLEVGQQVDQACFVGSFAHLAAQVVGDDAVLVTVHPHGLGLLGREGLQRAQVGGRFHQQAAAFVQQNFADQIQALL